MLFKLSKQWYTSCVKQNLLREMIKMITKEMSIGEVVSTHPELIETLMECGLHCLG